MIDGPWLGAQRDFEEAYKAYMLAEDEFQKHRDSKTYQHRNEALRAWTRAGQALWQIYEEYPPPTA